MSISSPRLIDVVRSAKSGEWNIPGFQRGFVWQRPRILLLLDSLFRGYPFGTVLNWKVPEAEGEVAGRSTALKGHTAWVIDGQQRISALCMLTSQKPYWWKDATDWDRRVQNLKPMIRVGPDVDEEFQLENPVRRRDPEWFPVRPFLADLARVEYEDFERALDERASTEASEIAKRLDLGDEMDRYVTARDEVKRRLTRLGRILLIPLPCQSISLGPLAVAQVFERVNRAGTRVRETDVTVAWVEAHNPGWVRESFLPFCSELENAGWDLPPSLLVPVLVAACRQNPDLRNVPSTVWKDRALLDDGWRRVKKAIEVVRQNLQSVGVPLRLVPSKNALFPCLVAATESPQGLTQHTLARMFLAATASGRYSAATGTRFREDSLLIRSAGSFRDAVDHYVARLTPRRPSSNVAAGTTETPWKILISDLETVYSSAGARYLRLLYFLTVFPNEPMAWFGASKRASFTRAGNVLDPDLKPEWHHFFPRAFMKAQGITDERVHWFGNIVVLDAKANRTISAKAPREYLELEQVHAPPAELAKQFVPSESSLHTVRAFDEFLKERHERITRAMNRQLRTVGLLR